ncbi:MAG: twin-arginine translocation signal domain-containing protein, partial [Pyrinomonadaceae bacterium]
MKEISRRKLLGRIATGSAGLALSSLTAQGQMNDVAQQTVRAFRGQHQPKPLPFDPAKLKGISEKIIRSHWENNYGG